MSTEEMSLVSFLKEIMEQRRLRPCQLARDLVISHTTVSRWLREKDVPSIQSCRRLAEYSGKPLLKILSFTGHVPCISDQTSSNLPEFREYAERRYPRELDDDIITMIEDLIQRRRSSRHDKQGS